jgi:hypothetical protein
MADLVQGDYDSLSVAAGLAPNPEQAKADAIVSYQKAAALYDYILLKYHTDFDVIPHVFPPGVTRVAMQPEMFSPAQWAEYRKRARAYVVAHPRPTGDASERMEYEAYLGRATERLDQLRQGAAR